MPWECPGGSRLTHLSYLKSHNAREADESIERRKYEGAPKSTSTSLLTWHTWKRSPYLKKCELTVRFGVMYAHRSPVDYVVL